METPNYITNPKIGYNRAALLLEHSIFWDLACQYDGIDPKGNFVVLSDDNPFTEDLNEISARIQAEARKGH